eukprot:9283730-Pyramimonas_sp.AAC.1
MVERPVFEGADGPLKGPQQQDGVLEQSRALRALRSKGAVNSPPIMRLAVPPPRLPPPPPPLPP